MPYRVVLLHDGESSSAAMGALAALGEQVALELRSVSSWDDRFAGHVGDQPDAWLVCGTVADRLDAQDVLVEPRPIGIVRPGALAIVTAVTTSHSDPASTRLSFHGLDDHEVSAAMRALGWPDDRWRLHPPDHVGPSAASHIDPRVEFEHDIPGQQVASCRVLPTVSDIAAAAMQLALRLDVRAAEDRNVVIGMLVLSRDDDLTELNSLAAEVLRLGPGRYLLITTSGPFVEATGQFGAAPFLHGLAQRHDEVRAGFGLGRTAREAADSAALALTRASDRGAQCAIVIPRQRSELELPLEPLPRSGGPAPMASIAARSGVSPAALDAVTALGASGVPVYARGLADRLEITERSARRILRQLASAGAVTGVREASTGRSGRPKTGYRLSE